MLDKKDLETIKNQLEAERDHLEGELAKIATKNPHNPDDYEAQFDDVGSDESDNTSEVVEYGLNLTLEHTLEKSLKDVKKTLDLLNKHPEKYGICKYCGEPIETKRLLARPTSSACVACKTKLKSL